MRSLRFLIVGLGSMGRRRIRNLRHLEAGEVIGFDPRPDRREEAAQRYGIRTVDSFEGALGEEPDAVVVSTPPDLHVAYALAAARSGRGCFIEASVVDDGMDELIEIAKARGVVVAPSCTMRFHPSVATIKRLVQKGAIGRVAAFTYHSGQYLPDWHPWEDYRRFYVARRETGACREIVPFELTWLTWVFGQVRRIACMKGKRTSLKVDIDDVYQVLVEFAEGALGHLLVDVVARVPYRTFRAIGEEGVIEWAWTERVVRLYRASLRSWTEFPEPEPIKEGAYIAPEDMYISEMAAFLRAVREEEPYPYSLEDDRAILHLLYEAERMAKKSAEVAM